MFTWVFSSLCSIMPSFCAKSIGTPDTTPNPVIAYKYVSNYESIWNDKGTGAYSDVSIWRPKDNQAGYRLLGDVAVNSHGKPKNAAMTVIAAVYGSGMLKKPESFTRIWWDKGSGAKRDVAIYQMNPPAGYTCLGHIAVTSYTKKPTAGNYRCVKSEYVTQGKYKSIWKDSGSGASQDVRLWSNTEEGHEDTAMFSNTFTSVRSHGSPSGLPYLLNSYNLMPYTSRKPEFDTSLIALKLYEVDDYDRIWKDKGSGAYKDVSLYRAKEDSGFYSLGDQVVAGYSAPSVLYLAQAVKNDALDPPTGFREVWNDKGSGAYSDVTIYSPICKGGYRAVGMVARGSYSGQPSTDDIRCVKTEYTKKGRWSKVWNDKGSDASDDVTIYRAKARNRWGQSIFGMSAVKRHGSMDTTAYVLRSSRLQYIVGEPAIKYTLKNVVYNFDDSQILTSTPEVLARTVIENQGDTEQSATRVLEYTYEETHDWSEEYGLEVGVESSITAGIPDIAEASITLSVTETTTTSWGESYTDSKTDSIEVEITIQGKSKKEAVIQSTRYTTDLPYTATLITTFADGTSVTNDDYSGVYNGAHIDEVYVTLGADTPLDEVSA